MPANGKRVNVPVGHEVQLVAPLLENVSASHSTHGVVGLASVSACPAVHWVHATCPAAEYSPAEQDAHTVDASVSVSAVPKSQSVQDEDAAGA